MDMWILVANEIADNDLGVRNWVIGVFDSKENAEDAGRTVMGKIHKFVSAEAEGFELVEDKVMHGDAAIAWCTYEVFEVNKQYFLIEDEAANEQEL